jgi:molybdopterin synthase catalytic subunit
MGKHLFDLRESPLSLDEALAAVRHSSAGAVDVFLGVVRDVSAGRTVTRLDYQAYAPMARATLLRIGEEIAQETPGVHLCALHRVGSLVVGDVAVICAASAMHRAEAFSACRLLIERIKAEVPVWKRELGADGSSWVGWVDARCADPSHAHSGT